MSNSKLVDYTRISPNSTNPRNHKIDTITIHHVAGVASVEQLGSIFSNPGRQASSNYGIGSDGRVGLYVDEANRSWCSSNRENDHRAITIEVSNSSTGGNWPVSQPVMEKLIDLCVDICRRNDIKMLNFTGDKSGNLTMHKWFAATACPGPYLESKFQYIADEVNKRLGAVQPTDTIYRVQVGAFVVKENAEAMLADLKKAGFDGFIVTEKKTAPVETTKKKTVDELAKEVIQGKWGSGVDRKNRLTAAGYDYNAVQKEVNRLLK